MRENLNGVNDLSKLPPEEIDQLANKQGKMFVDKRIKTNQIRNIFSSVSQIRNNFKRLNNKFDESIRRDLVILKPKLAYAAGRNLNVKPFQALFDDAVTAVLQSQAPEKALENFFFLAEAIVAYHRFHGGKNN